MLQNSRTAKLKGLKKKEISSTGTSKNDKDTEVPEGKNREKNSNLWIRKQIIQIPIKIVELKVRVTIK